VYQLVAILTVSGVLLWFSRRTLAYPASHGFYRFFAWESIAVLIILNLPYWFDSPASALQLLSWALLAASIGLGLSGFLLLRRLGGIRTPGTVGPNFAFENTSRLVTSGAYRYLRHPLYGSLLFLGWGAYLKSPSRESSVTVFCASLFLFITARVEESENLARFGEPYALYMKQSWMFIPHLF